MSNHCPGYIAVVVALLSVSCGGGNNTSPIAPTDTTATTSATLISLTVSVAAVGAGSTTIFGDFSGQSASVGITVVP